MSKIEILAPVGSEEMLRAAVFSGADAVYLGFSGFNARTGAGNFDADSLKEAVRFCHARGVKVHVTLNTLVYDRELSGLADAVRAVAAAGADAVIADDLATAQLVKSIAPTLHLHGSTQMSVPTPEGAKELAALGYDRVILARELSLEEIAQIGAKTTVELEAFVHGAMCISYSGRCLLSSYLTGRDGNRGACAQACRWEYTLHEKNRPGESYDIEEDAHGTYVMNSKDLCLIARIPQLVKAGICSLKIEGRMKSVHYVATVASVYRKAIDAYMKDPDGYKVLPEWLEELNKVSHRPYTEGFAFGTPGADAQVYTTSSYEQTHDFVGIVLSYDKANKKALIEQRNNVKNGEKLELLMTDGTLMPLELKNMQDEEGTPIECAPHARQHFWIDCAAELLPDSLLRRKII